MLFLNLNFTEKIFYIFCANFLHNVSIISKKVRKIQNIPYANLY